jgi:hypothetical protein
MKTRPDRLLVFLLRLIGLLAVGAVVPVFMPFSWMGRVHQFLGLGELPHDPIVEYLARSLSAFYAFFGALCLWLAADLDRHRLTVRFVCLSLAALGACVTWIDMASGLPNWWIVVDGPPAFLLGLGMHRLATLSPARDEAG